MSYDYSFWKGTRFGKAERTWDKDILRFMEPGSVLDIGCGAGRFVETFKDHKYTGVDISKSAIEQAREDYPNKIFGVMDLTSGVDYPRVIKNHKKPNEKKVPFDNLFSWTVLEHILPEHIEDVVKNIKKSAKNIVIAEPNTDAEAEHCFNHDYESLFNVIKKKDLGSVIIYKCKGD